MKNQYFADINDYRKYGLLRAISRVAEFRSLVAWMLTPDDGSTDGKFTEYLSAPEKWEKFDPELYAHLRQILSAPGDRKVDQIQGTGLLDNTKYYSEFVPDNAVARDTWFAKLLKQSQDRDLVFLDPDNGLEIKSRPYGSRNSSKFLFWREVQALWQSGASLLIYQHFIRESRVQFVQRMLEALNNTAGGSYVEAFSTSNVVFLLALQAKHHHLHETVVESVQAKWAGQIKHWELVRVS